MASRLGIGAGIGIPFRNIASGGGKPYLSPEVKEALKAVVIAYGKTNNDSDRAVVKNLVDASNPFIISNAAYKLNSGYGLYGMDFLEWKSNSGMSFTSTKLTSTKPNLSGGWLTFRNVSGLIPETKVKVSGAPREFGFIANNNGTDDKFSVTINNGVYTIPEFTLSSASGFYINNNNSGDWSNLVIEQIPSYQGAFVTDGVDDLITSTKTVQEMGITDEITVVSMIGQLSTPNVNNYTNTIRNQLGTTGSYNKIAVSAIDKTGIYGYSFDSSLKCSIINDILGDKQDYSVSAATQVENIGAKYLVQGWIDINGLARELSPVAWYWTIIANKVLTTDQINQVIAYYNLDRCVEPTVLYDVKRQGLSNDTPDSDWYLKDFSKNGFDMSLFNFAKDEDSGIGKYNYPNWKINVTQGNKYARIVYYDSINGTYSANFKGVTGLYKSYGLSIEIKVNRVSTIDFHSIKEDGIYTMTPPDDTTSIDIRFGGENVYNASCDITITQIPSHAGALCLDGVNDFGKVTGMPIYKDYTVVADYIRTFAKENAQDAPILSKSKVAGGGAFLFNYLNVNSVISSYSFGTNNVLTNIHDSERKIYYQSKYVNDGDIINSGTETDYDTMWLGTYRDDSQIFFTGAIYSLMTFPYSLSEFLIERQLKKHKLGTLYPDMVEFRPIVNSNVEYSDVGYLNYTHSLATLKIGDYVDIGDTVAIRVVLSNTVDEVVNAKVNGQECEIVNVSPRVFDCKFTITSKSPQKMDITIDEYIRYEDIVQPYPAIVTLKQDGKDITWGDKLKVGDEVTFVTHTNLLPNLYTVSGAMYYNGKFMYGNTPITVAKSMTFTTVHNYIKSNEPKCILSPSRLRIPNSSYKILGYIPDISGHGNHGKINNSAYAEGSGVNEDGSYQFDGVDDFITIPTTVGGKQVLMKVNWQSSIGQGMLYDQRGTAFAIWNSDKYNDDETDTIPAYSARNEGNTYIDGILNKNILASQLRNITHNIVATNTMLNGSSVSPTIGCRTEHDAYFTNMSLYDFMLFDEISTDEEILTLNKYIGIKPKVTLPPYYWDVYGKSNTDEDKATIQQRGVAVGDYDLTNNNLAYEGMSGYNGYSFASFNNENDWYLSSSDYIDVVSRNGYKITLKNLSTGIDGWRFQNSTTRGFISKDIPFKVKANKPVRVYWDMHSNKLSDGTIFNHVISNPTLNPNEDT